MFFFLMSLITFEWNLQVFSSFYSLAADFLFMDSRKQDLETQQRRSAILEANVCGKTEDLSLSVQFSSMLDDQINLCPAFKAQASTLWHLLQSHAPALEKQALDALAKEEIEAKRVPCYQEKLQECSVYDSIYAAKYRKMHAVSRSCVEHRVASCSCCKHKHLLSFLPDTSFK